MIGTMASGIYETLELRDGGSDYLGKGVLKVSSLAMGDLVLPLSGCTMCFYCSNLNFDRQ
jgi:enolase